MKEIKHIFFDLDHTLWDHETNARKVLGDIYEAYNLESRIKSTKSGFLDTYSKVNAQLWDDYNHDRIDRDYLRDERFRIVLEKCGATHTEDGIEMSTYFLHHCPRQGLIMDGADMVLNYLAKKYTMSIITNGFDDVQKIKLETSGLDKFFSHLFTSESIGRKKPHREIFDHALKTVGHTNKEAIMIGDSPKADIEGARNAGIIPIFYNPLGTAKSDCQWQISHLSELMKIL